MMNLRNLSIKNKLVLMQVFTTVLVSGFCIAAFVINDINGYKERKVASAYAIAQLAGFNSISAIQFMDNAAAKKILSELNVQKDLLNATILDNKGRIFASYTRPDSDSNYRFSVPKMGQETFLYTKNNLFIYRKITKDEEPIGLICIRFELSQLNKIKMGVLNLGLIILAIGIGLAFTIAIFIKKYISKPLVNLVNSLQQVTDTADFKIRLIVEGKDEISILTSGINNMLSTIEKRDAEVAQSKDQLNTQNTLLQSIIKNMGDGLIVIDQNGKFMFWNPASEKIIGMVSMDIPLEKWAETYGMFWPNTNTIIEPYNLPMMKVLHGEEINDAEIMIRNYKKPDGDFILISGRPLKDSAGNITGGVFNFHDITERKNSENQIRKLNENLEQKVIDRTAELAEALETLRKSEEKYREIIENTSDVVLTADYKGNLTYINPACKKLTGYDQNELLGKSILDLVETDWKDSVAAFYLNQFKNKIDETLFSFPILTKSREIKWIEQTVNQVKVEDTVIGHKTIMRDITERKSAEKLLKESEDQLQIIFNEAPDALIIINDEGVIMRWNPQAEKIFGWSFAEVNGKSFRDLIIPKEQRGIFEKEFQGFLNTGEENMLNTTRELRAINKENSEFEVEMITSQATVLGKSIFISFVKDISFRKKLENEKKEADKLILLNEIKLKLILENIGEGIIVTDTQKRIVLSNHMAEEIIGITVDPKTPTLLDWSAKYNLFYPDEVTTFPSQNLPLDKALKGESTDDVELIIEDPASKTKKRVVISGRPILDENNYIIAAVSNIKDITTYKQLEDALEESEQKYRNLIGFKNKPL